MTTQTETLKRALELAHEGVEIHSPNSPEYKVCSALIALTQPEQEPVGYFNANSDGKWEQSDSNDGVPFWVALPPQPKEPEQEPVARSDAYYMIDRLLQNNLNSDADYAEYSKALDSIYTTPPQRTWVGLTKDEIETLSYKAEGNTWTAVELAEAKLKEKNT